jgi:heat shock protein HslJ
MYCGEPGVMLQENTYLTLLSRVNTLAVEGDRLTLKDGTGATILSFAKSIPTA